MNIIEIIILSAFGLLWGVALIAHIFGKDDPEFQKRVEENSKKLPPLTIGRGKSYYSFPLNMWNDD